MEKLIELTDSRKTKLTSLSIGNLKFSIESAKPNTQEPTPLKSLELAYQKYCEIINTFAYRVRKYFQPFV